MNSEVKSIPASIEGLKDTLVKDIKSVVGNADHLLKEISNSSQEGFAAACSRVENQLDQAKARLGKARDAVGDSAECAAGAANDYVRENPWKVAGAVAAVGLLLRYLFSRR